MRNTLTYLTFWLSPALLHLPALVPSKFHLIPLQAWSLVLLGLFSVCSKTGWLQFCFSPLWGLLGSFRQSLCSPRCPQRAQGATAAPSLSIWGPQQHHLLGFLLCPWIGGPCLRTKVVCSPLVSGAQRSTPVQWMCVCRQWCGGSVRGRSWNVKRTHCPWLLKVTLKDSWSASSPCTSMSSWLWLIFP